MAEEAQQDSSVSGTPALRHSGTPAIAPEQDGSRAGKQRIGHAPEGANTGAGVAIVEARRYGARADELKPSAGMSALARWLLWPEREPLPEAVAAAQQAGLAADALVHSARAHGLAPLLHYRAKKAGISFVPAAAAVLTAEYHASLSRNAYLYQELARLQDAARKQGVEVLALKGAHLAAWLYPSPATRPMVDVDLLVRREQAPPLVAALTARDYQVVSREPRPGTGMEFENQLLLAHAGNSAHGCVALHWSLLDFPSYQQQLCMQDFWEHAVVVRDEVSGIDARVLGGEELLVYLCAHLALHHQWSRMIWLCDIALLLARLDGALDWERICALAGSAGLTLAVRETLRHAAAELYAEIPERVWLMLAAAPVGAAERYAWQELTQGGGGAGRSFWVNLRAMPGVRARLAFAFAHLLPSPGYMRQRYQLSHDRQLPGAYARRWLLGLRSLRRGARPRPRVPQAPPSLAVGRHTKRGKLW